MSEKILIDRAVVEQALEMLNRINAADDNRDFLTEDEAVCTIMAIDELDAAICAALEQPQVEQEPVAVIGDVWTLYWVGSDPIAAVVKKHGLKIGDKLYTHPQPPRQPLTEQQINDHRLALAHDSDDLPDPWDFKQGVRAAEHAHGIKEQK